MEVAGQKRGVLPTLAWRRIGVQSIFRREQLTLLRGALPGDERVHRAQVELQPGQAVEIFHARARDHLEQQAELGDVDGVRVDVAAPDALEGSFTGGPFAQAVAIAPVVGQAVERAGEKVAAAAGRIDHPEGLPLRAQGLRIELGQRRRERVIQDVRLDEVRRLQEREALADVLVEILVEVTQEPAVEAVAVPHVLLAVAVRVMPQIPQGAAAVFVRQRHLISPRRKQRRKVDRQIAKHEREVAASAERRRDLTERREAPVVADASRAEDVEVFEHPDEHHAQEKQHRALAHRRRDKVVEPTADLRLGVQARQPRAQHRIAAGHRDLRRHQRLLELLQVGEQRLVRRRFHRVSASRYTAAMSGVYGRLYFSLSRTRSSWMPPGTASTTRPCAPPRARS